MGPETMQAIITFISLLLTGMGVMGLWLFNQINSRLGRMENKLDGKMDETDHEKQSQRCTEAIMQRFSDAWERFDVRINGQESKFCNHSHEGLAKDAGIIFKKG